MIIQYNCTIGSFLLHANSWALSHVILTKCGMFVYNNSRSSEFGSFLACMCSPHSTFIAVKVGLVFQDMHDDFVCRKVVL